MIAIENTTQEYIDPFKYQQIRVAVDTVCIAKEENVEYILMVKRKYEPFRNAWALPGGFLKENEELETGAVRELSEETAISIDINPQSLVQIKAYGTLGRDPRPRRIISVAFLVELHVKPTVADTNESVEVVWIPVSTLLNEPIAFDHKQIIGDAIALRDGIRS